LTPIIQQVLAYKEKVTFKNQFNSPLALVIVPGRELADQIGVCSVHIISYLINGKNLKLMTVR